MDLKIIAIYYICDEVVSILRIQDDPQCKMSTAEAMGYIPMGRIVHGMKCL